MRQYFTFVNATKRNESNAPLPFNFGVGWAKNLNRSSHEDLSEIFDFVIKANNWEESDEVIAIGDYGDIVYRPEKDL